MMCKGFLRHRSGEEGALRIIDASTDIVTDTGTGILEIFHAGSWGTFCNGRVDFRPENFEEPPSLSAVSSARCHCHISYCRTHIC